VHKPYATIRCRRLAIDEHTFGSFLRGENLSSYLSVVLVIVFIVGISAFPYLASQRKDPRYTVALGSVLVLCLAAGVWILLRSLGFFALPLIATAVVAALFLWPSINLSDYLPEVRSIFSESLFKYQSTRRIFATAVARYVLIRKIGLLGSFIVLSIYFNEFGSDAWPFLFLAGISGADLLLIAIRQFNGTYGSSDLEVWEAARFVISRIGSGGGPRRFDRVFSEQASSAEEAATSIRPEAAR
jgi:hypothetical protein